MERKPMSKFEIICIIIIFFTISSITFALLMAYLNNGEKNTIISTSQNLNDLKNDSYAQGFIDGRGSVFEEQSSTGYSSKRMGVPSGYESNRTKEWRECADAIVRGN